MIIKANETRPNDIANLTVQCDSKNMTIVLERDMDHAIYSGEIISLLNETGFTGSIKFISELKHTGEIADQIYKWKLKYKGLRKIKQINIFHF